MENILKNSINDQKIEENTDQLNEKIYVTINQILVNQLILALFFILFFFIRGIDCKFDFRSMKYSMYDYLILFVMIFLPLTYFFPYLILDISLSKFLVYIVVLMIFTLGILIWMHTEWKKIVAFFFAPSML